MNMPVKLFSVVS